MLQHMESKVQSSVRNFGEGECMYSLKEAKKLLHDISQKKGCCVQVDLDLEQVKAKRVAVHLQEAER